MSVAALCALTMLGKEGTRRAYLFDLFQIRFHLFLSLAVTQTFNQQYL